MPQGLQLAATLSTDPGRRAEPIRRRTLVLLRWIALGGQLFAIIIARMMEVEFATVPALLVVAIAAALNLWMTAMPSRVTQTSAAWQLVFDLLQISVLVALTGGLSNPFALLVLAPVTIAATALGDRQTILVGLATIIMISAAAWFAAPLQHPTLDLAMPPILQGAHLVAILIGVVFFAVYARRVSTELATTSDALSATQIALAREQKLQHLGGVVAAAAHEMGTPLATIKLIASELRDELQEALPYRTDLAEDAATLTQSADRCRDIMRSMGRAGKDDLKLHAAPLRTVLEEAAEPHTNRGIGVEILLLDEIAQPTIRRDPGVIHGLRNIIQNGVDFAHSKVIVSASWTETELRIAITDNGPGYPQAMLSQLSDPFPITRRSDRRPSYDGMGLGLFIARALLEGSGARLILTNGAEGAKADIVWPLARIIADDRQPLSANPYIS
ncbi:ActS/PrrB/RegB family redox-sensitive histidine kinase [Paracoccus albus]|uniref:ActS/PrrB/RegB family redox-sensitive histidine kinase n=1 Tax=Paracoccus albus TaxID=3017784 RepID=UPI0022F0DFF0|nr:ActS/PrrB/RegB family redox-sensitive histidine kinase [Paracoccus albus]WBU60049.1 ActS/PrrB/RegB family redox-sensitive histidine kinase [Paracoccus albus]